MLDKHRGKTRAARRARKEKEIERAYRILKQTEGSDISLDIKRIIPLRNTFGSWVFKIENQYQQNYQLWCEAQHRAGHFTTCSCTYCGNPRRKFGELTLQERKQKEGEKYEY